MALTAAVLFVALAAFGDIVVAVPLAADNTTELWMSSTGSSLEFLTSDFSTTGSATTTTTMSPASVSSLALTTVVTQVPPLSTSSMPGTTSSTLLSTSESSSVSSPSASSVYSETATSTTSASANLTSIAGTSSPESTSTTTVISTVSLSATTVTTTAPPQTVTDTITIVSPPTPSPTAEQTTWAAPAKMTDLSAFNIEHFASGQNNMRIVVSDPPLDALASESITASPEMLSETALAVLSAVTAGIIPPPPPENETGSFLQLYYPANSINPSQEPRGGAEFYARPLDLSKARNVSMEYSVFFPSDFDWVKAGKMPGIYGGHEGCSGGDDATDCFSTRLMWREGGDGELYLYARKDKQTMGLCNTPPQSVCDSEYGLSIGRGSFKFAAGNWTHVKQTVVLNTPGEHDGEFTLDVNSVRVIERHDVLYRDGPLARPEDPSAQEVALVQLKKPYEDFTLSYSPALFSTPIQVQQDFTPAFMPPYDSPVSPGMVDFVPPTPGLSVDDANMTAFFTTTVVSPTQTITVVPTSTQTAYAIAIASSMPAPAIAVTAQEPIGFIGLFFSTFFGGHEPQYATPKDQFTWFKDFSMAINA